MPTPFFAFQLSQYIFGPLLFLLSVFIILIILLQRGRGGGLTGALGGAGGSSAFGVKAGDIFTRITAISVLLWICLCAFVCWWYLPETLDIEADPSVTTTSGAGALSIGPKEGEAIPAPAGSSPLPASGAPETPAPAVNVPPVNLPAVNLPAVNLPPAPPPATEAPATAAPATETPAATPASETTPKESASTDAPPPVDPAGTSTEPKP
ncbi:preprotein translocase subunit SecG [Pirellula sp. SH-Sr6A]|uniref:preprotein translocase subunit SecG n=1 Tax=Pirellula sp. SH-Sr6A TaxID=1632865 RepID=UPI00078D5B6D|nr:preprotein translocase subunit SecG [Pirellula sp. SH-Sr6A]AMV30795.1 preprotein translocase subunit SecG [Pirellula sp. SH-Sr6A]